MKNFCGSFGGLIYCGVSTAGTCWRCFFRFRVFTARFFFFCGCPLCLYVLYNKKYHALEGVYLTCGGRFSPGGDCIRRLFFGVSSKHQQAVGGFIPAFCLFCCFSF